MTDSIYRYSLVRKFPQLGVPTRTRLYVMLNPSTAEATETGKDDQTIRKLIAFSTRDGFTQMIVENLAPFRATDPTDLIDSYVAGIDVLRVDDNDQAMRDSACVADQIVVAWGANAARHPLAVRSTEVTDLLRTCAREEKLWCFGETNGGWPKHPLYLAANTALVEYGRR